MLPETRGADELFGWECRKTNVRAADIIERIESALRGTSVVRKVAQEMRSGWAVTGYHWPHYSGPVLEQVAGHCFATVLGR